MTQDTYGHTPVHKMFDEGDVYGVRHDEERARRKPLRLGIIGAGGVVVSKYLPAIKRLQATWEPVELAAFARRDERAGRHIQETWGGRWYQDPASMLSREQLDAVIVASPNELHAEHASACIEKGLPTLVEKPFTHSLAAGERLCRLADARGVPLMCVANKRCSPPYRRARRFVAEGPVGSPAMFAGKFTLGYDYILHLLEAGTIHMLDLARFFMGDVASLSAVAVDKYHRAPRAFDNVMITLSFRSGSIGQVTSASTALSLKPWERVEVFGNKAWLAVEDQWELRLYESEEGACRSWTPTMPNTLLFDEEFGGFTGLIENFLQCIRGVEEPVVTGWDGLRACELAAATHLSLARRAGVTLPLDPAGADAECAAIEKEKA